MKIFSKKYDLEKDHLRIVFDSNTREYLTYYGKSIIPHESLNRKSKKILNKKNAELINNPTLLSKEIYQAKVISRFKKLESLGYSPSSFEYLGTVNGTMSKELEKLLSKLTKEENVLLGVHRLGSSSSPEVIEDILTSGLKITGHLEGAAQHKKSLGNNVSYYPDNKTIIKELMYASEYKNSKGSILIRIPDTDLTGNIFITDQNRQTRLNPKYIVGYIPVDENHHIEEIIQRTSNHHIDTSYTYSPNYCQKHPYDNSQEISKIIR